VRKVSGNIKLQVFLSVVVLRLGTDTKADLNPRQPLLFTRVNTIGTSVHILPLQLVSGSF